MTTNEAFEAWWKLLKPAECDEVKPYFVECWQAATLAERERCAIAERERCATICDALCDDQWAMYKGLPPHKDHPARGSTYTEGVSDGAGLCADKIRQEPAA